MMRKADYILKSSRIYKGTGRKLIDGFVAVKGEKIMFAGPFDQMEGFTGPETKVMDFGDKVIMPCLLYTSIDRQDSCVQLVFNHIITLSEAPVGQDNRVHILTEDPFAEPWCKRIQPAGVFLPVHSSHCIFHKGQAHKYQYKQIQLQGQSPALHIDPVAAGPDLNPQQKEQADNGDIACGKVRCV